MHKTKQLKLAVLITGIIISLLLVSLFKTARITKQPIINVTTQQKQVEKNKAVWQIKINLLNKQGAALSSQLRITKTALERAKGKSQLLQVQLYNLIDGRQAATPDSVYHQQADEKVKTKLTELIQSGNENDSLYEAALFNLEEQVGNRDAVIATQEHKYQSLNASFETSLAQQKILTRLYSCNLGILWNAIRAGAESFVLCELPR